MIIGKYRLFRTIGDGSFATVKLGFDVFTKEQVAVKIINKCMIKTEVDMNLLMQEVEVMRKLDHPGIVKFYDFLEDDAAYYLIIEYCGGGELFDFIISRQRVEEILAKRLFKQILLAVNYIHSQNIVHRDLKPENLLLTENNTVKLIDFGLCSINADKPMTNRCGSACYIAPEALTQQSYMGQPADVWALGVILYALVDGSLPWNYEDPDKMYKQITTGSFAPPKELSPECLDLIQRIFNPNPDERLTIQQILAHPWFYGVGNVFPIPKPQSKAPEFHLSLSMGGFSSNNLMKPVGPKNDLKGQQPLETIYEDEAPAPPLKSRFKDMPAPRSKPVQPRSISLGLGEISDPMSNPDDGANTHRGAILSQTISHRDPNGVANKLENTLLSLAIQYTRTSDLEFNIYAGDLQIVAEVCRLYGFRNVYVVSFSRLRGDSWSYTQFVQAILNAFKDM